jgi:hypothetical protein
VILRRVIHHVRKQEWTAIWIDLVIVVVGVFIGIQVSNWNEARADRAAYEAALGRLSAEIDTNLASLDAFDADIQSELAKGSKALTVLQSCVESEENIQIVEVGLNTIRATAGLFPRRNALDEATSNPRLLSQQSAEERARLSELRFYFDALQSTANFSERQPMEYGMEDNPIIRVGKPYSSSTKYFGFDWVSTRRSLELGVSLAEACQDNKLVKSFFNWERRQSSLPVISRKWRAELMATKQLIEARR